MSHLSALIEPICGRSWNRKIPARSITHEIVNSVKGNSSGVRIREWFAAVVFAETSNTQFENKYIFVTGSMIPQK